MKNYENYEQVGSLALKGLEVLDTLEEYTEENTISLQEQYFQYLNDIKWAVSMDQDDFCTAFMYA